MDYNKILGNIEILLDIIKRQKELDKIYKITNNIFKLSNKLSKLNKELTNDLKNKLSEIMASSDLTQISKCLEEIEIIINQFKNIIFPTKPIAYISPEHTEKNPNYEKDCIKYSNLKANIKNVERKIITAEEFSKKYHDLLKKGKYKGCLHARLTKNLRIVYSWDPKTRTLIYKNIVTHDELN